MDSTALAEMLLGNIDTLIARMTATYLDRVPRLRELSPSKLDAVVEATHRTVRQFCRYYLTGTLGPDGWQEVREATLERAGETFTHDEILEIIEAAHAAGLAALDDLRGRGGISEDDHAAVAAALGRYIAELAEEEDRIVERAAAARLDDVLDELEREGTDLA